MGRPSNVLLILRAVDELDRGRGCTTPRIYQWLLGHGYEPPSGRAIAQVCGSLPGVVLRGRARKGYVVWRRGPLLEAALRNRAP